MEEKSETNGNGSINILQALERDLLESGKRTLRDCLRSKSLPCREVKNLLSNSEISYHQIVDAFQEICQADIFGSLSTQQTRQSSKPISLWHVMTKIATVTKFLQLLFEWDAKSKVNSANENQIRMIPMVSTIIKNLCELALSNMQIYSQRNDASGELDLWEAIATNEFHGPIVASFTFGSLVRLNAYIKTHPALVSPWLKGLCDIASATPNLPTGLLDEGLRAIVTYLKEGDEQAATSWAFRSQEGKPPSEAGVKQQQMLVRILMFLIARGTSFAKLALNDEKKTVVDVSNVFAVIANLLGLPLLPVLDSLHNSRMSNMPNPFVPLTTKLKECICKLMFRKCTDQWNTSVLHSVALEHFLKGTHEEHTAWKDRAVFGKMEMILTVLNEYAKFPGASFVEPDVEGLLALCKELIFHCLPLCQAHLTLAASQFTRHPLIIYISRSIQTVSKTLLLCELRLFGKVTNADRGRAQYHRLLLRWLSPTAGSNHHPLSREIIISLLCLHVLGLHRLSIVKNSISPRSVQAVQAVPTQISQKQSYENPLLSLLVKILFDTRSQFGHRDMIVDVLMRLLHVGSESFRSQLENRISDELAQLLAQTQRRRRDKKRKRSKSETQRSLSTDDINIICRLTSKLRLFSSSLERELEASVNQLLAMKESEVRCPRGRTSKNMVLTVSLLEAMLPSFSHAERQSSPFTDEATTFWMSEICCSHKTWSALGLTKKRVLMATSLVRFTTAICDSYHRKLPPELVGRFAEFVSKYSKQASKDGCRDEFSLAVLLEVVLLLGNLGKVILPDCAARVGEAISNAFRCLQKRGDWPLVALTMTSLERFGSTMPSAHRDLLPRCTRKEHFGYFQSRLQGNVWKFTESPENMSVTTIFVECAETLQLLIPKRLGNGTAVFPTSTTFVVPDGSYFMMVPTREGRKAVAIFPPTPESLEDIDAVLGLDEAKVLKLRRVISNGNGCKFLLQP